MDTQIKKRPITLNALKAKVKELGGWIEGGKARFPTVNAALKFESWLAERNAK